MPKVQTRNNIANTVAQREQESWRPFDYDAWHTAAIMALARIPKTREMWIEQGWLDDDGYLVHNCAVAWLAYVERSLGYDANRVAEKLNGNTLYMPTGTELIWFGTNESAKAHALKVGRAFLGKLGIRVPDPA